jgi:acetyl-CoA hydrolase
VVPGSVVPQVLAALLRPGDRIVATQTLSEPTALLEQLFAEVAARPGDFPDGSLELVGGMSLSKVFGLAPPAFRLASFVGMGPNTELIAAGRMELVPCHLSDLPLMLQGGAWKPDVALVLASPPDASGVCSMGLGADYAADAVRSARTVIAEISDHVPRVGGDTDLPFDRLAGHVETDRPLPTYTRAEPSDVERTIAARVAVHVVDGSCLQIGIGRLGEAILAAVADRKHLGVHSGMVGDTALEMVAAGIITNQAKPIDTGRTVAGSILGSSVALKLAAADRSLELRSIAYTHDPSVIAKIARFVCIGSALEVDLLGQVNAEVVDGRYLGGIGGAVDFLRAAVHAPGGRSIIALPATGRGGASRIVPTVARVTAARSDVDVIVTEHGTAELRGASEGERTRRIIGLAAPEHRDTLWTHAKQLGLA